MMKNWLPSVWRKNDKAQIQSEGHPFLPLQREMNRMFDDFFRGFDIEPFGRFGNWSFEPSIDVWEDDKNINVKAELPGMDEKDIELNLTDNMLSIRGEKKDEKEDKKDGYFYRESRYGSFSRVVPLPEGIDAQKVEAKFNKGVLTVTVPKPEGAASGKKIPIKTA